MSNFSMSSILYEREYGPPPASFGLKKVKYFPSIKKAAGRLQNMLQKVKNGSEKRSVKIIYIYIY
jgi:hypothetical protein